LKKAAKIASASLLRPQNPALLLPLAILTLSSLFHVLNASYYPLKKQNNSSKFLLLSLPNFCTYFSLQTLVFVDGGRKNISCPRAQGTPATPLNSNPEAQ